MAKRERLGDSYDYHEDICIFQWFSTSRCRYRLLSPVEDLGRPHWITEEKFRIVQCFISDKVIYGNEKGRSCQRKIVRTFAAGNKMGNARDIAESAAQTDGNVHLPYSDKTAITSRVK